MRYHILFALFLSINLLAQEDNSIANNEEQLRYWPNGELQTRDRFKNGKKDGLSEEFSRMAHY